MLEPATADPLPETLEAIAQADLIYDRTGVALYVADHQPAGARDSGGAGGLEGYPDLCLQPDDAGERVAGLDGVAAYRADQPACGNGAGSSTIALINTAPISARRLEQYEREGQSPIEADLDRVREMGVEPVTGNFVHEGDVLRHDYDQVTEKLLSVGFRERRKSPRIAMPVA